MNSFVNAIGYSLRTDPTFDSLYENTSNLNFKEGLTSLTKYFVDKGTRFRFITSRCCPEIMYIRL